MHLSGIIQGKLMQENYDLIRKLVNTLDTEALDNSYLVIFMTEIFLDKVNYFHVHSPP